MLSECFALRQEIVYVLGVSYVGILTTHYTQIHK